MSKPGELKMMSERLIVKRPATADRSLFASRQQGVGSRAIYVIDAADARSKLWLWIILWTTALATRLLAAWLLPNAEQDGYSYAEMIARWSASFSAGHFRLADLFGFWLPLFPIVAAIPNTWIGNALLVGKILTGLCGAVSCVLIFAITEKLTRSIVLACVAFAIVLSSPLHILYSAACMTDIPHACLVLASLWCALQRRWMVASIFAAFAEGVRVEAWSLIILLPLIQFLYERRISLLSLAILLLPPLAWLCIGQLARGDPFAFFAERARYQTQYLAFHGSDMHQDADYFLLGANYVVFFSIIAAAGLSIWRALYRRRTPPLGDALILGYNAVLLGFVLVAYVTGRQPVLLPRYGLIFFVIGVPLLMCLIRSLIKQPRLSWFARLIAAALIALCLWQGKKQLVIVSNVLADFRAHRQVAQTLALAFREPRDLSERCFSDDAAVRVLSGLPADCFVRSATAASSAHQKLMKFESYLRQQNVAYLVFTRIEDSLPVKFYPNLGRSTESDSRNFQLITVASSPFAPDIWLYRLHDRGRAP